MTPIARRKRCEVKVSDIGVVDRHASPLHVVEARDEGRQRRLARPGVADQRDDAAGSELERTSSSTGRSAS